MRAILLCAGVGQRFRPITNQYPKPLVPINGIPLIERTIGFLHESNITNILVVTGYERERFSYLQEKYDAKLIHNSRFATHNNWSSLYEVREHLDGSLIIDGDLFLLENIFQLIHTGKSQFISQPTTRGKEWELIYDENNRILSVNKDQSKGYGMVGVSYWENAGAKALAESLHHCEECDFWEDAALRILDHTEVYAMCIPRRFVQEVDCVKDALDFKLLTHEEVARLTSVDYIPQQLKGLTNNTWKVRDHTGTFQCLRVPGSGTDAFINRDEEPYLIQLIENLGITPKTSFFPHGLKFTRFLEEHRNSELEDLTPEYFDSLARLLNLMHEIPYSDDCPFPPALISREIDMYASQSKESIEPELLDWIMEKTRYFDTQPKVFCHRDLLLENILIRPDSPSSLQLIDFEYAGFTHPLWDAASFILEAGLEGERLTQFHTSLKLGEVEKAELYWMEIIVDYIWGMWGRVNNYHDYADNRLKRAKLKFARLQ